MRFSPGLIVVALTMLIFYLRIVMLRGRKKRLEKQAILERRKLSKKGVKLPPLPDKNPYQPPFQVTSWLLVVLAMLLMLFGLAVYNMAFLTAYKDYWWIPVSLGVLVFTFCFKVEPNISK